MKYILAVSTLLISAVSSSAFANHDASPVSAESLEVVEAVTHCAATVQDLAAAGRLHSVQISRTGDYHSYTLTFVRGGYAPTFQLEHTGTLEIRKSFQPSQVLAPDAPGGEYVYQCLNLE